MPKFPEGKELLLINMANTREIGTPQPQIPTEKQICANTSVYESEGWTVELMRMLYVNTAIPLSNLREAPKYVNTYEAPPSLTVAWATCGGNKRKADMLVCIGRCTGIIPEWT